ncbi:hypothetical protein C7974DRAFT_397681 [Boeremia exigua]|uniref:uncharacterized protein n=1 Tax=Boeremia exigua TaxID=749465 RepID=UPI001E8E5AEE|nr:uncharacterized protein C7974DRAFT_397681 [Boeremia exigua]KAH6622107.1 hypothetical protein C7974DRAFT_397681 [Boeremia exigua]
MMRREAVVIRHRDFIESCMLALILLLAASKSLILYGIHDLPYTSPFSALCTFFTDVAVGLRLSIPFSSPIATLIFVASFYFVRPERLVVT